MKPTRLPLSVVSPLVEINGEKRMGKDRRSSREYQEHITRVKNEINQYIEGAKTCLYGAIVASKQLPCFEEEESEFTQMVNKLRQFELSIKDKTVSVDPRREQRRRAG